MEFSSLHTPVLHEEIRELFLSRSPRPSSVIDATLGLGGHASILLSLMEEGVFFAFDRDQANLDRAKANLSNIAPQIEKYFIGESFATLRESLGQYKKDSLDFILYDLGVSSVHLDQGELGFSLRFDGPLDMRFDRRAGKTARDLVMTLEARELSKIFELYGEEKKAWFIAQAIVKYRKDAPIDTTAKLIGIISESSFDKKSPLRVFQALRIAVNEEFAHIEDSLAQALELLSPGGMIAVITFHSLEDRLVKQFFAPYLEDTIDETTGQIREKSRFAKYTKKPIIPSEKEIQENPRSRSAKLRVIQRKL